MADEAQGGGPSKPPPQSGPARMTVTRQRLGTGRPTPAGGAPPPEPEAEPAAAVAPAEESAPVAAEVVAAAPVAEAAPSPPPPAVRPAAPVARPAPPRPTAAAPAATGERLAAAVRKEPAGGAQSQSLVYVWPHLVTIEFLSAALMLVSMIVLSWVINSPLEGHANVDKTPNPSKAPWYFLNLQELLLHMHPALAGVLVPAGALTLIAAIPYFDRDQSDVGKWFGTKAAVPITIFVAIYTTIVESALVFFDELYGVKPLMRDIAAQVAVVVPGAIGATLADFLVATEPFGLAVFSMSNVIVPSLLMLGPIAPMMWLISKMYRPTTRDVMIALFTGFVASYLVLTIFGTFFRGQGMHLCWMTDPCQTRIE